jgi:hypothetical protein
MDYLLDKTVVSGEANRTLSNILCLYKESKLTKAIRIGRLRWAGHVQSMEDEQMPKRLLYAKTSMNVGRPRSRWLD